MKYKRKNRSLWLLLLGIWVMVFPQVRILYNEILMYREVTNYSREASGFTNEETTELFEELSEATLTTDGASLVADAQLEPGLPVEVEEEGLTIADPFSQDVAPEYVPGSTGTSESIFGYIRIPKIGETLPLYIGATNDHLRKGAAQVTGSSLPVGGPGSHSVISAHRGYSGANFFRFIDRLVPGDRFTIHVLDRVLTYEITGSAIIPPNDTSTLMAQPGEDLVTLLSCHPYRVNNLRILLYARRVPEERSAQLPLMDRYGPLYASIGNGDGGSQEETHTEIPPLRSVGEIIFKFTEKNTEPSVRRGLLLNRLSIFAGIIGTTIILIKIRNNQVKEKRERG